MDSMTKAKQEWDKADKLKHDAERKITESYEHLWVAAMEIKKAHSNGHSYRHIAQTIGRRENDVAMLSRAASAPNLEELKYIGGRLRNVWEVVDLLSHTVAAPEIVKRAKAEPSRSLKSIRYEINQEEKAVEKLPEIVRKASKEKKIETLSALAEDEAAVEEALSNQKTHTKIGRASRKAHEKREKQAQKTFEAATGGGKVFGRLLDLHGIISKAHQSVREATRYVQKVELNDQERTELIEQIAALEEGIGWLRSIVEGGGMVSDSALEKLMADS